MKAISELKINKSQIESLSDNLHNLMKTKNITEAELAKSLNLPLMTIRRIVQGETTDPRISTLKLIADFFNVSVDVLIDINQIKSTTLRSKTTPQFIPVLDWHTVSNINSIDDLNLATLKRWQPITLSTQVKISEQAFALESRPSMQPRFPTGSIFIIEPKIPPSDGDVVLIKITNTRELTLRELVIDPPDWQLHPIVPGSSTLSYISSEHHFVGIVLLTLLYNRRMIDN